ncbi:MAG: rhomboid family intramembrane serine protease [Clostridiales bacterium]|nr:rhomboid family intramembrane serine protease [Clostridiales bacterium]
MIREQLDFDLIHSDWTKINTNIEQVSFYYIKKDYTQYVVSIIDDCSEFLSHPMLLEHLLQQSEPLFSDENLSYQMLCIVLTTQVARTQTMIQSSYAKWLIDLSSNKLIIFEDQPSNFLDLRQKIESICESNWNMDSAEDGNFNYSTPIKQKFSAFLKSNSIVNSIIILLNVLIFIIMEFTGDTQNPSFMHLYGALSSSDLFISHEYFRTVSSIFLHFGIQHLLSNMIVLWALGTVLERLIGSLRYTGIYLVSGIGANIISMIWYWHMHEYYVVSAGASGAIFGVVGTLLYIIIRNKGHVNEISGKQLIWLCIFTFFHGLSSIEINNSAHFAGLIIGFFCGIIFYRTNKH